MINMAQLAQEACGVEPTIEKTIYFEDEKGKERCFDVWFYDGAFNARGCRGDQDVVLDAMDIADNIMEDIDNNIFLAKYKDKKIDVSKMNENNKDLFRLAIIDEIEYIDHGEGV